KGLCGKPKRKPKTDRGSIYLTNELFRFDVCADGVTRLFIGTRTNNIGYLSFKSHRPFNKPKSLYIRKEAGQYFVSFCYEDNQPEPTADKENLKWLKGASEEWLNEYVVGVDRGVVVPAHTGDAAYRFSVGQARHLAAQERYRKRLQRRLAKQVKGSNRRNKVKQRISKTYRKQAAIRNDFCHQTSRKLVDSSAKVIIFEALNTSKMTRKPKARQDSNGKYLPNRAKAKAGLNKSILNVGWHYLEAYAQYKAARLGKAVFKISPAYTSQECSRCGHTHPGNRKTQALFFCGSCGYVGNADANAALVIKKRAIKLFLDSGTELQGKGIPLLCTGRGAGRKTGKAKVSSAVATKRQKRKERQPLWWLLSIGSLLPLGASSSPKYLLILSKSTNPQTRMDINMTQICTTGNQAGPLMPCNPELMAATDSPDNSTQRQSNGLFTSTISQAIYSVGVGAFAVVVKNQVVSPLNEPGKVFLRRHCFNNMTRAEFDEYGELTPFTPVYLAEIAVTSTAYFVASGGLCKVYEGCKSIYDRVCSHFSAPDATARRHGPEEV
uniref:RNA-guided endonuclease InsQ/TnpB family protein n=1 Tax=Endozoicomonas sp. SESOKO1 TaxID=2828742 RepID=UPI0021493C6E